MKHYNDLNEKEKEQLLKFPVYISLLAATAGTGMDKDEKDTAMRITHVKSFASDPVLIDFYKEAEHVFKKTLAVLDNELPHNREKNAIQNELELNKLESLLKTLDPQFVASLGRSLESYKYYISKSHQNVLEYFIFPMPIDGITD